MLGYFNPMDWVISFTNALGCKITNLLGYLAKKKKWFNHPVIIIIIIIIINSNIAM